MKLVRTSLTALGIVALSLGLSACGKKDAGSPGATQAAPMANIAPPAGKQWSDVIATTPEGGFVMGNPDAPIKLIEYGSLTCPHCAEFTEKGFPKLRDNYIATGRVSFEFRNFVRDKFDTSMAMLTHCGSPESFFALTDQVFANQKSLFDGLNEVAKDQSMQALPDDKIFTAIGTRGGLVDFFAARGIAKDQALACLANTKTASTMADNVQKATEKYDITGTPTFILNGNKLDLASWDALEPFLQAAGAR
jgi:protein-disulfide isomerase